jgi:large subunit ribosomal protein L21
MFAVVKTGGKQYRVKAGDTLTVEKLPVEVGAEILLDKVLMLAEGDNVTLGKPLVAGASVRATVLAHTKGEKIKIFKMRRRKHYRKTLGHRQSYTELRVDDIQTA